MPMCRMYFYTWFSEFDSIKSRCSLKFLLYHYILIVIVNSRFLHRPQRRSRGKHLIHRRLPKTKSIGRGSDPESPRNSSRNFSEGNIFGWIKFEIDATGTNEVAENKNGTAKSVNILMF